MEKVHTGYLESSAVDNNLDLLCDSSEILNQTLAKQPQERGKLQN
jgi:hypothetical protein